MKGLYFNGKNAEYTDTLPVPVALKGQSLIKILYAAVCSTDKEILRGYRPDFKGIIGHEFVGIVKESDNTDLIGKRVVGEINEVCGNCLYCKTGRSHHCSNRTTPGLSRDGCFAEYMVLKTENLHVVPDNLPSKVAVFTEPLAAAFEIYEQTDIAPNTPVAVLGDGRLALCIANVLKLKKADVTIIGKHTEKLNLFKSLGKTTTEIIEEGYEIVVDATGSPKGISTALKLVRKAGLIIIKSTYADNAQINLSLVPVNEIRLLGSRCGPFEPAIKALSSGEIILPELELYNISDWQQAFNSTAFKAGFDFT